MCEIPKPRNEGDLGCATQADSLDLADFSLAAAATMLVNGLNYPIALDWSPAALAACNGLPKQIEFFGTFPDGLTVCLNCTAQIDEVYATLTQACVAKCEDLLTAMPEFIPDEGVAQYCLEHAKLATNHEPDMCYPGACTDGGTPIPGWVDPRRTPEAVMWIDHIGTDIDAGSLNDLKRTAATTGTDTVDFNAGAASAQIITKGDAWVEFSALNATDKAHVLGVRESVDGANAKCFDASNCQDGDPSLNNIGFAIALNTDGSVFVFEIVNGALTGQGPFGTFSPGERYRVNVKDNLDGTATITYSRKVGAVFTQFAETTLAHPEYPLRVDTSFREQGAIIENATIVRIK
jgi:hypothetical protein